MECCIAIVDDELELLELLEEVLSAEGFSVIALPHPDLVHHIDATLSPNVFLLDMMLPGTSGLEVAERLRTNGFDHTPMIAMSASSRMLALAATSNLFQSTLAKPFDLVTLLETVARYTPAVT